MAEDNQAYLPISDAMARDIDSGKAANRPFEDFLPDEAAQAIYDLSQPGPVRAENLIPISKAEAARRTQLEHDGSLPKMPATRRVIPAPYRRDRVTGGAHGKAWAEVAAVHIHPGDIITDVGLVVEVRLDIVHEDLGASEPVATGETVVVTGKGGTVRAYGLDELVRVFRKHQA